LFEQREQNLLVVQFRDSEAAASASCIFAVNLSSLIKIPFSAASVSIGGEERNGGTQSPTEKTAIPSNPVHFLQKLG